MFNVSVLFTINFLEQQPDIKLHQQYIDQPVANWPILVLTTFNNTKQNEIYM